MTSFPETITGEHLLDVRFTLAPPEAVGAGPYGTRAIFVITGGTFEGPKLRGNARPGGADWLLSSASHNELDVRATLETDDGALIYMTYRGVLKVDGATTARVMSGESVDPAEYYFRTAPRFETGHENYVWLNSLVCVGYGVFGPEFVTYRVFAIT
jgi:hypothetical protein